MSKPKIVHMVPVRKLPPHLRPSTALAVGILAALAVALFLTRDNWALANQFPGIWTHAARGGASTPFFTPSAGTGPTAQYLLAPTDIQVFSRDPLVIYIRNFVSQDEISHLLKASIGKFKPSHIFKGFEKKFDLEQRISETATLEPDDVTERIWGWSGSKSTFTQPLKTQRYDVGGFYSFHHDWDKSVTKGNRVATFMVYLAGNCTGGGTNFPGLKRTSEDARWCEVVDCEDQDYEGVTFKPVVGSAVYWENMHPNGSFHLGVEHAALPVKSGEKVGLNVWLWDPEWTPPPGEAERHVQWRK